jgi:hypothetical protein
MTRVPRRAAATLALCLGIAAPHAARAQSNTAETLVTAVKLYEDLQVERSVVLLRQVLSPSTPYEVSREQRVRAYKYLGAALAVLGQRDSAVVYLRAAIERDPFVDMDPQTFSPPEREALEAARLRTFAVAARPVSPDTLDPRTGRTTFTLLTTHAATMHAELQGAGAGATSNEVALLVDGDGAGSREISWTGVLRDGRLAPPGRYALAVRARSTLQGREDSARVWLDIRHLRPALEDTLPALGPADLLPVRHSRSAAGRDLLRGATAAAAALVTHGLLTDRRLGGGGAYATSVSLVGVTAGTWAFVLRQRRRDIPGNVAENRRREAARATHNADVTRRNLEKLAQTRLVLTPAAGVAP